MRALADGAGIVFRRDAEHEATAVDLHKLGPWPMTCMPTGVAASCDTSSFVPTLLWPSSRPSAMALQAAFSIRAIIYGVANTGSAPEPTAAAVFSGVTTVEAVPDGANGNGHGYRLLYFCESPPDGIPG